MYTTFTVETDRVLSYQAKGDGPAVVCVPGGPGLDPEAYFAPVSIPGRQMVVIAPRGTGASTPPASPDGYRAAGYADDLEQLRLHLGLKRLSLYGSSHGGVVALAYACQYPDRVERLAVSNTPLRIGQAYAQAIAEQERRFSAAVGDGGSRMAASKEASAHLGDASDELAFRRLVRAHFSRYVTTQGPAETAYLDRLCAAPVSLAALPVMMQELGDPHFDLQAGLGRVTVPVLVLAGELDVVTSAADAREITDALPSARYVRVPGVGHFPEVEAPDFFRATVGAFFAAGAARAL